MPPGWSVGARASSPTWPSPGASCPTRSTRPWTWCGRASGSGEGPRSLRVLALDLGSKRVGVAVSDATATLASPLATLARSGDLEADHRAIAALVAAEEAAVVVVGLPLNMDGSHGP